MEPEIVAVLMMVLMLVLIILEMPIAFAIALSGSLGIVLLRNWGTLLYALGSFPVSTIASFTWAALPLYILLGSLVQISGVGADAYEMAHKWFAKLKGGLVMATIVACGLIGATSGAGTTAMIILGKIAVPEMEKLGYDRRLAVGAVAGAGPVGTLIPPSMPFVVVGILAELSIGKLFIAGIMPGILSIVLFSIMVYVRCVLNPKLAPAGVSYSWKERFVSLRKAWGVVVIFMVIIGGLYTGIATATEVAAIGCLVALIMVFLAIVEKKCSWKQMVGAFVETIGMSAMIFAFVLSAAIFSLFLTISGLIQQSVVFIQALAVPTVVILIIVVVIYFIMGCFFTATAILMLTVPLFYPILVGGLGVDPIWLSVIVVIMCEVGVLTPPVGMALFVMHGVYPKASLVEITSGAMWFVAMHMLVVVILFVFPQIATWLPNMMMK